jgi:hypothetical protein
LAVGAHLAAEDAERLDGGVDDARVGDVGLVQAAEGDAAEGFLAVVGLRPLKTATPSTLSE